MNSSPAFAPSAAAPADYLLTMPKVELHVHLEGAIAAPTLLALAARHGIAAHPLPRLLAEGLYVTLNSDDPVLFSTTLTQECQNSHQLLELSVAQLRQLSANALAASLLPAERRAALPARFWDSGHL